MFYIYVKEAGRIPGATDFTAMFVSNLTYRLWFPAILLTGFLFACNRKQLPSVNTGAGGTTKDTIQQARILYLTLEAKRDTVKYGISVRLIQQQLVPGTIKPALAAVTDTMATGSWSIHFLDKNSKPVHTLYLPDPLQVKAEFVSDKGELITKTILLIRAEIPLRLNYQPAFQQLSVAVRNKAGSSNVVFHSLLTL